MKNISLLFGAAILAFCAHAQVFPNPGFETWRTTASGSTRPVAVKAPTGWFGADSLIIADGQFFGPFITPAIPDSVWKRQLYIDSGANAHSGTYSAMLVTKRQDTLGVFPGILSNAKANISISLTSGVGPITYSGGTRIPVGVKTVSAWVKYAGGSPTDSGQLSVDVYAHIGGVDSVVGSGFVRVGSTSSFAQVTATVTYPVAALGLLADTVRVYFASSCGGGRNVVGSTLWADDVSMTLLPVGVAQVEATNAFSIYPNPAANWLNVAIDSKLDYSVALFTTDGKCVRGATFTGNGTLDIQALPVGIYYYDVTATDGTVLKRGTVSVVR